MAQWTAERDKGVAAAMAAEAAADAINLANVNYSWGNFPENEMADMGRNGQDSVLVSWCNAMHDVCDGCCS